MANNKLPPASVVRQLLRYEDGKLYWNYRPEGMKAWNLRFANRQGFTADNGKGYKIGSIHAVRVYAHHVVWCMHHGDWPTQDIDHINWDRGDNRIENLRQLTHAQNCQNFKDRPLSSSGHRHISWAKERSQWVVKFKFDSSRRFIGRFDTLDAAIAARDSSPVYQLLSKRRLAAR